MLHMMEQRQDVDGVLQGVVGVYLLCIGGSICNGGLV